MSRSTAASFTSDGSLAGDALSHLRNNVAVPATGVYKAPVRPNQRDEVGSAFQTAHNSSGWDRKARWQRAVNLAKAKMGISGPDESIDKWGPASKEAAAAESEQDRRRGGTPLNRRSSVTGGLEGGGGGRGGVHSIAELRTPIALKEHLKRGKAGVRDAGIQLATLEVGWEPEVSEEDAAAMVAQWDNRRQMLGALPSPTRAPPMSPADRALRAWTNPHLSSSADNSTGPSTPLTAAGPAAAIGPPVTLAAAIAAAGRGIVPPVQRRFSENGTASFGSGGGGLPAMRRSGVYDSIIARRQPQLLDSPVRSPAADGAGAPASGGSMTEASPARQVSLYSQDSGGAPTSVASYSALGGSGSATAAAPPDLSVSPLRFRASNDGSGSAGSGLRAPLMAPPTFGRQRLPALMSEGSGSLPLLPPLPSPDVPEAAGSLPLELSVVAETSEAGDFEGVRYGSSPTEAAPIEIMAAVPPPPLVPVPPPAPPQEPSPAGSRPRHRSRTSAPGDGGGSNPNSTSGALHPAPASLPSPLPPLPDNDDAAGSDDDAPAPRMAPPLPADDAAAATPRLTSPPGPTAVLPPAAAAASAAPLRPSSQRFSTSGAHAHASPPRQHSPAQAAMRRPSNPGNLILAAAGGGGGGGGMGGLNIQGTGLGNLGPRHAAAAASHHPSQHYASAAAHTQPHPQSHSQTLHLPPASSSPLRTSIPRLSVNGDFAEAAVSSPAGGGGGGGAAPHKPMTESLLTGLRVVAAEAQDELARAAEAAAAARSTSAGRLRNGVRTSDSGGGSSGRFRHIPQQFPGDGWRKYG